MAKKPYSPMAPYAELKRVEDAINKAETVDEIRQITHKDGPKVGYKAFCYMLTNRMTAAAMKPDDACTAALQLEEEGNLEAAQEIYKQVLASHADHPIAKSKVSA
ncbi:MAG: hypothetical protein AAF485_31610 [Chloroflexota bacterium]